MKLTTKLKGKTVKILNTEFDDESINHKLSNIGIIPGNILNVLDYDRNTNIIHVELFGVEYVLRSQDCLKINVQEI